MQGLLVHDALVPLAVLEQHLDLSEGFGFRASGFGLLVSDFGFRVSGSGFLVSVFEFQVPILGSRV